MDLKFRARDSKNDLHYFSIFDITEYIYDIDYADDDYFYIKQTGYRLLKRTIERSTGITGIGGVKIYEGDIIETNYNMLTGFFAGSVGHIGHIEYVLCEWVVKCGIVSFPLADLYRNKWQITIIGNIRDNKDLLK